MAGPTVVSLLCGAVLLAGSPGPSLASAPRPLFRAPACLQDVTVGFQTDSLALGEPLILDATQDGILDVFVTVRSLESMPSPSRTVLLRGVMQGGRPDLFAPNPLPNGFTESLSTTLLAVADINGDAKNDFISADGVSSEVAVQLSMPSGGFDQTYFYTLTDGAVAQRLFVVDMDDDGFVDVMIQAWDPVLATVVVMTLRNGGTGFLEALPTVPLSSQADVALGDLNGDLRPDILEYSKIATTPCQVRLSTGAFGFQAPEAFGPAGPLMDALVVQANPGGVPDVALLGANQSLFLCYGSGGGAMAPQYDSIPLDRPTPRFLATADLNLDGAVDYIVSNSNGNSAGGTLEIVGLGNPVGMHTLLSAGQNPGRAIVADLDRDGHLDIVTAPALGFGHRLSILFGPLTSEKGLSIPIAGSNPRSPTLADLNRDGTPDILATLDLSIQLRLRDAMGNYTSGTSVANGLLPQRQVAGDFNRDALPDLLFANFAGGINPVRLRVYKGNGVDLDATPLGPFGSANTFLPQNPVADMNRDGIPDVITINGSGVGVRAGDGAGGFPVETFAFALPSASFGGVAAGDLDRDGDPDLVVTTDSGITLLASDGVSTLTSMGTIGVGVSYRSIAVADVNRDGKADIIAYRSISGSYDRGGVGIDIFYTDGTWNVLQQRALGAPEHSGIFVDSWDVDRNGLPDIVATGLSVTGPLPRPTVTAVYLQDSPDHFAPRVEYSRGDNVTLWDGVGDVDGDGQRDIFNFLSDGGSWNFAALQGNSANGAWGVSGQQDLVPGGFPHGLACGDMNRDGTPDMVIGDLAEGAVRVLFGYGNGDFVTSPFSVSTVSLSDVALADFDRDGRIDVVGANEGGGITILLGIGDYGALGAPVVYDCPGPIRNIRIGDFNRDGKPDVAAYGFPLAAYVFICGNNGTFTLTQSVALPGPGFGANLAVGDFNRDGIEDLAMSRTDPIIYIAFGVGDGTFGTPTMKWINFAASTPTGLSACDVNLDGMMDLILALADSNTNPMIVLNGDGAGNFPSGTAYPSTSTESDYFATGFLNGDQWPDIVQSGLGGTSVRLGTGGGALGPRFNAGSYSSPQGVIIADLDRDGMNDIALNDAGAGTTLVLLNSQTNITAVEPSGGSPRAARPTVSQNAPNPFNPKTTITFTTPQAGPARLAIFDVQGRLVVELVDQTFPAGAHRVDWDGRDASGRNAASGVYFYRLEAGGRAAARRMVLMK